MFKSRGGDKNFFKGFTLIEVIIVVGIISVLSLMIVVVVDPISQIQKTNDSRRKSDLAQVQKALETYYQDNGRYPNSSTTADSCGTISSSSCPYRIKNVNKIVEDWGQSWQPYMNVLPKDPKSSNQYIYQAESNGQAYYLYANLERGGKDPQACNGGNACSNLLINNIANNACGGECNYGVSSPNVSP